jgi:hypothetical protein
VILLPWLASAKSGVILDMPGLVPAGEEQTWIEGLLFLGVGAGIGYLGYQYLRERFS